MLTFVIPCLLAQPIPTAEDEFVFLLVDGNPISTLDPLYASNRTTMIVEGQIFEGLFRFDLSGPAPEVVPNLIEMQRRPDSTTYVFRLRETAVFHPHHHGGELQTEEVLDAHDVEYSLLRAKNSHSRLSYLLKGIEHIDVVGPDLISITLSEANEDFRASLATSIGHIVCKDHCEGSGAKFGHHPIGTGPYMLSERLDRSSGEIVLEKFAAYWDASRWEPETGPRTVVFRYVENGKEAIKALSEGVASMSVIRLTDVGEGLEPEKVVPRTLTSPFISVMIIDVNAPHLAKPCVRRALNAAVSRDDLLGACPTDPGRPTHADYQGYARLVDRAFEAGRRNTAIAEAEEDLARLRSEGRPLRLFSNADPKTQELVSIVAKNIEENLALEVEIVGSFTDCDLIYVDWHPDIPPSDMGLSILYPLFCSTSSSNLSQFCNQEIDSLFNQIRSVSDKFVRPNLQQELEDKLLYYSPLIWLPTVRHDALIVVPGYEFPGNTTWIYWTSFLRGISRK